MQSKITHLLPLTKIRRSRMLPVPGTVLVRTGQAVEATDLIAEVNLNPKHILLDFAQGLGVSSDNADKYLKREIGEEVNQDGIIAAKPGNSRVVRAPVAGKVVTVTAGKLLLQINKESHQLLAGVSGIVSEIKADYGAIIDSTGAWIQGVWGNKKINYGNLNILADFSDHILSLEDINSDLDDAVIYAGYCDDTAVLETAELNNWSGLILGSMSAPLIPFAMKMPYPIIVLEGFGHIKINEKTHKLITTSAGRKVCLNAMKNDSYEGKLPEITIPLPSTASTSTPQDTQILKRGTQIRILRSPYMGKVGTYKQQLPGMTRFPSGIQTIGAEIILINKDEVRVPLANIEVLG